jgi:hypothetical protein
MFIQSPRKGIWSCVLVILAAAAFGMGVAIHDAQGQQPPQQLYYYNDTSICEVACDSGTIPGCSCLRDG